MLNGKIYCIKTEVKMKISDMQFCPVYLDDNPEGLILKRNHMAPIYANLGLNKNKLTPNL